MDRLELWLSKSRVMLFDYCPWKYKKIYKDGCTQPDTVKTMKGTMYHAVRDECIERVDPKKITKDFSENYNYIRSLLPKESDPTLDTIAKLEAERAVKEPVYLYKPVIVERDYTTLFCDPKYFRDYPEYKTVDIKKIIDEDRLFYLNTEFECQPFLFLKGRPDNIYMLEDGTYSVYEFKTGAWNSNTASKIRKELAYYVTMLQPHMDNEITHIAYCYTANDKIKQEKIQNRSIQAFKNLVFKIILANLTGEYSQKFYYKACQNCNFCEQCELSVRTGYV